MDPWTLLNLAALMERTRGRPDIRIGLIDGPVVTHPDLAAENIRTLAGPERCARADSPACTHGTFVAGILAAKRGAAMPGLCPDCTLLVRPVFGEPDAVPGPMPSATPAALAEAIGECLQAGARVLNLSLAPAHPSPRGERELEEALDHAVRRGAVGSWPLPATRAHWAAPPSPATRASFRWRPAGRMADRSNSRTWPPPRGAAA